MFYIVRTLPFGIKLYNSQRNAQVFLSIYIFPSALHVSGLRLAHLQMQVYNFGSGSSLHPGPDADTIPRSLEPRLSFTPVSEDGLKESP
jgi:hypothetical protein